MRPPGFPTCTWPETITGVEVPVGWPSLLGGLITGPGLPLQVGLHYQRRLRAAVRRVLAAERPDAVVMVLSRLGSLLDVLGGLPTVLDYVDCLELNMRNRARRQRLLAPLLRWEASRVGTWDRRLLWRVQHATVVSSRDRSELTGGDPRLDSKVSVLPFGLRLAMAPPPRPPTREVVLLSGNLGYFPTVDGALWFAREVWPRVRQVRPEARWCLAGARPGPAVRRLAVLPGVDVLADPPSLQPIQESATVAIAPLRSGSGTPIKVLEAMAAGIPVVATPSALSGLDDLPPSACAVADMPAAFASAVAGFLAGAPAAQHQTADAWTWLSRRHRLETVAGHLEELLETLVAGGPPHFR